MFKFFRRNKPEQAAPPVEAEPIAPPPAAPATAPSAAPVATVSAPPAPPPAAVEQEIAREEREQQQKVAQSLQPTRRGFFSQIGELFSADEITSSLWDDLQDLLVLGDCGVDTTNYVLDTLERQVTRERIKRAATAYSILKGLMVQVLEAPLKTHQPPWVTARTMPRPYVVLIVGVNGVGKTTSIAKLTRYFQRLGNSVLLAAGDTFRAAAIDQLQIWADRVGAPLVAHQPNSDPGAVVFDAMGTASTTNADMLIIDTAGRLHNKTNLMDELRKLRRICEKQMPGAPHDVLLVIDATTGQNGLQQAKIFTEVVEVSGVVLTKLDGTAKGGIAFAISRELGLPIRFVGTGEKLDDLAEFDANQFVEALFA
ncbi:MAG TPA: signal recognition particle-docking protein FtsY [Chloroflexia bacterium]|nr:signal recognition particle-docking protein FtsY [Chloroflexia bacterium]